MNDFGGSKRRGPANGASKLTADQVLAIRRRRAAGERQVDLAREFGVGPYTIRDIQEGRTWGWLDDEDERKAA